VVKFPLRKEFPEDFTARCLTFNWLWLRMRRLALGLSTVFADPQRLLRSSSTKAGSPNSTIEVTPRRTVT